MALITRRIISCRSRGGGTSRLDIRAAASASPDHRQVPQVVHREQPRPQAVVQIMRMVGDVVGDRRHLGLGARLRVQVQLVAVVVVGDVGGRDCAAGRCA